MNPKILAIGLVALCLSARAADLIPVEDFAKNPAYSELKMSLDGEYVGFIREHEGVGHMCFADVATMKTTALTLPGNQFSPRERQVSTFQWIGPKRVLLTTNFGMAAVDRDRKNFKDFGWQNDNSGVRLGAPDRIYDALVAVFRDDRRVLVTNLRIDHGRDAVRSPEVTCLDTVSGNGTTIAKNPGAVVRWIADTKGFVRVEMATADAAESILYCSSEKDGWQTMSSGRKLEFEPKGFSEDGASLYVVTRPEMGVGGLYRFDPEKKEMGEIIWKNPVYEPHDLVRDPATQKLVGVRYVAEYPKTQWLDARYAAFQVAVDKVLPGQVNELSGFSSDLSRVLVKSSSDRNPSAAYVFNTATGEVREIGKSRGWIKADQMATMRPISFVSREGIRIYGYLTIPVGVKPESLPLVVLLREGLHGRNVYGFDPQVQFLASRGYAVFQVNHRGSSGYGWEFRMKGDGETGGKVQADIEDGVRWIVSKKIADPQRIAIMGTQYGGYSALYALGKSSDLYKCGVAIAPIADWPAYLKDVNSGTGIIHIFQGESPFDTGMDAEKLMAVSPVNFAAEIQAPVLVIRREELLPEWGRQARGIISALEKVGHSPEVVAVSYDGAAEKARATEYRAIEVFLVKHLGAGAAAAAQIVPK